MTDLAASAFDHLGDGGLDDLAILIHYSSMIWTDEKYAWMPKAVHVQFKCPCILRREKGVGGERRGEGKNRDELCQ